MAPTKNLRLAGALAVPVLTASSVFFACSSDDNGGNPTPMTPVYTVDGSANDATVVAPGDDASESDAAAVSDAQEETPVRSSDAACTLDQPPATGATAGSTCWNCTPVLIPDFINHCSGTGVLCQPFDNTRLPGFDGGALPSLN